MLDEYVSMRDTVFTGLGKRFNDAELTHLRGVLEGQLTAAYSASPRSNIVISYDAPLGLTLNYALGGVTDSGRLSSYAASSSSSPGV